MKARRWLALRLLPLLLLLALTACKDEDARTQVMLEIDADPAVRARLQTLRVLIDVSDDEGESWQKRISNTYRPPDIGGDWADFEWPARLGLVPAENGGDRQLAVRVQALDRKGELYVWQQAVAKFTPGHTKLLSITLVDRCTVAALACGDEDCVGTDGCETCRAGRCVAVELLDELPEFDADSTGSLFDGSVPIGKDSGPPDARTPDDSGDPEPDSGSPDGGDMQPAMDSGAMDAGSDAATEDSSTPAPFTVTASTPSAAAPALADTRGVLSVTFSAAVDAATVTPTSLTVEHEGRAVAGAIAITTGQRGATFTPDAPWVLAGAYTLSLSAAIKDEAGTPLQPFTLGFEIRDGVWSRTPAFDGLGDPVLSLAGDGYGAVAWLYDNGASPAEIRASLFTPGTGWAALQTLSTTGMSPSAVAINTRHHAVAIWLGTNGAQTAHVYSSGPSWVTGNTWAQAADVDLFLSDSDEVFIVSSDLAAGETLEGYQFTLGAAFPAEIPIALTMSANRQAQVGALGSASVVVWQHSSGAGLSQIQAGNISGGVGRPLSTAGVVATSPNMAVNRAQTTAVAVWLEANQNTPAETRVWAAQLPAGGTWSAAAAISSGAAPALYPKVAVDDRGRALATWTETGTVRSAAFDPSTGSWSAPIAVSTVGALDTETSSVVLAPDGNGVAVWAQNSVGMAINEIWASRWLVGRGWQNPTRARISDLEAGTGSVVALGIDDAGRALAAWYQSSKIWVARFE